MTPAKCRGCQYLKETNYDGQYKLYRCTHPDEERSVHKIKECPIHWIVINRELSDKADEFAEREYSCGAEERDALSKGYYWGYIQAAKDFTVEVEKQKKRNEEGRKETMNHFPAYYDGKSDGFDGLLSYLDDITGE